MYWFCHTSTWIRHRYTCVPHPEPPSFLRPRAIPLGRPSAPASSNHYHVSSLDWRLVSYMILYTFQCHSPKSSHPLFSHRVQKTVLWEEYPLRIFMREMSTKIICLMKLSGQNIICLVLFNLSILSSFSKRILGAYY